MRIDRGLSALAGLAAVFMLAGAETASAQRLNYTAQTTGTVSVSYFDMPPGTQIFLLNEVSGTKAASLVPLVSGSGTLGVPVPTGPGQYHILAQQAGAWVAVTVMFYTD